MRKSFELFDDALEASLFDDLGRLDAATSAITVAALPRATGWWSNDTSTTAHVPSLADGELIDDALARAVWAGLICTRVEPRRSLSLSLKLRDGQRAVSGNTIVLPLLPNRLVLFDAESLSAGFIPSPALHETGVWLICASRSRGGRP